MEEKSQDETKVKRRTAAAEAAKKRKRDEDNMGKTLTRKTVARGPGKYRGKPDKRSPKFVLLNADGTLCLAPSLTWFCIKYHISKGYVSDMRNGRILSHMGWYLIQKKTVSSMLELVPENEREKREYKIDTKIANDIITSESSK